MVVLNRKGYHVRDRRDRIEKTVNRIEWDIATIERGGFPYAEGDLRATRHRSEHDAGSLLEEEGTSRVSGLNLTDDDIKRINRIVITACGTRGTPA
jgi:glucosamine 6-phosphate synthetase-like amidotransferase/phosphosugar isomerase protein